MDSQLATGDYWCSCPTIAFDSQGCALLVYKAQKILPLKTLEATGLILLTDVEHMRPIQQN